MRCLSTVLLFLSAPDDCPLYALSCLLLVIALALDSPPCALFCCPAVIDLHLTNLHRAPYIVTLPSVIFAWQWSTVRLTLLPYRGWLALDNVHRMPYLARRL